MSKMKVPSIIAVVIALFSCYAVTVNASPTTFALSNPVFQEQEERVETVALPSVQSEQLKKHIPERYKEISIENSIEVVNVDFMPVVNNAKTIELWLGHDIGLVTAERTRFAKLDEGGYVWQGTVKDHPGSSVWISVSKRFGKYGGYISVVLDERQLVIETLKSPYLNFIWEIDKDHPDAFPSLDNDVIKPKKKTTKDQEGRNSHSVRTTPSSEPEIIDVLVLFSYELPYRFYDVNNIINEIEYYVNNAFTTGATNAELRIVGKVPIPYPEVYCDKSGLTQAWNDLKNHSNEFADVGEIRDTLGADLVVWMQCNTGGGLSGTSIVPPEKPDTPQKLEYHAANYAFFVMGLGNNPLQPKITFAHELGHLLSLHHDASDIEVRIYEYGNGFFFGPNLEWGTLMSVVPTSCDKYHNGYSDDEIEKEIDEVLYAIGDEDTADSNRAIREYKGYIADFRSGPITTNNYIFMTPVTYDDDGANSHFITAITPEKADDSAASIVVCNPGSNPWSILPGSFLVGYAYGTNEVWSNFDNGYNNSYNGSYIVGYNPGGIVGNSQGAVSSAEVAGSKSAFSAVIHFKEGFVGTRELWVRYRDDANKRKKICYGQIEAEFTDVQPVIPLDVGDQLIAYHEEGTIEYKNVINLDVRVRDGNSATNIEKFYIYITQEIILPTDPDIVETPSTEWPPVISVRPYMKMSAVNYNNICNLFWDSNDTYHWTAETKIKSGNPHVVGNHTILDNSRTYIQYQGSDIRFTTRITFDPPFEGMKNVYLRAIDYEGNDTGYIEIGEINIVQ